MANDTPFGLSSGIATTSLKHAEHFKRNSAAGMVMVNLPTAGVDYHVPFGGRKASSYGPREQGRYAVEFYITVKTLHQPVMELSLQVGKYDIQKLLGKGASGTVYLAKDTFTGKEVALKTIEPEVPSRSAVRPGVPGAIRERGFARRETAPSAHRRHPRRGGRRGFRAHRDGARHGRGSHEAPLAGEPAAGRGRASDRFLGVAAPSTTRPRRA